MSLRRPGPRPAVIGTCTFSGPKWYPPGSPDIPTAAQLLADGLARVDAMAREAQARGWRLDIALLPEHFAQSTSDPCMAPQPIDGEIVSAMAGRARAWQTHIAVPLRLSDGDTVTNSVVLLDRQGEVAGLYHKVFPVLMDDGSMENGITPGRNFPVFDLDFGRVGIQICFDVFFEEGWEALARQEAELVLFPTAAPGVSAIRSHAYRHGYWIAISSYRPPVLAVDPAGRDAAMITGPDDVLVFRADLDYRILPSSVLQIWGPDMRARWENRIDLGWHPDEGLCLVTSLDPALPVARFLEETGQETQQARLSRSRIGQNAARGGPPETP
ncbi:MAG: carbon-nitrogen hydrolase family protein [Armatimonadetes bacterium]|nr:carbon-nitrogen hydrolase family protein [Armatimonadota bacterium]